MEITNPHPTPDSELEAQLRDLIARGLRFSQVLPAFAERNTPEAKAVIAKARDTIEREGELEIDDSTIISEGADDGAYVLCWVWVPE